MAGYGSFCLSILPINPLHETHNMDVRHHSSIVQPRRDALQDGAHFCGMPKRGLAFLLANVMFWQPMWAQADGIVVANPNTSLDRAGNGVPIINIATPNASGLSHNQFHDYNVGAQGVILNNGSTQTSATQLGGHIIGNPNLKSSGSAQAILNEVISGNPSQLRGYTEVAGQAARVIVANPYGITCNGCGFINAPRVTLTTGKPVLENGRLDRFQVDQGSVVIEGTGLNASNVDHFEIITRSAKINAQLQAQNLTIVAGRNDVNAQTLDATARADDGSAQPQLAIDSAALGGMYAGAIKLVGTEAGVGVKLDGKLIASGGDIQLDANGQLSLADTSATGAVNVKAASLDARGPVYAGTSANMQTQDNLTNRQTLAARDNVSLSAGGQLTNTGAIEAGVNADGSRNTTGDLSLIAKTLDNTGKSLTASRNLTVSAAQSLNNQGGRLSGQTTVITAAALNNSNGEIASSGTTRLNAGSANNRSGQVLGDLGLDIDLSGAMDNRDGVLGSAKWVSFSAASLDNRDAGALVSDGGLSVRVSGLLDNRNKGEITAKGAIDAQTGSLDNRDGKVIGKTTLVLRSDSADNRVGTIQADQQVTLSVGQFDNRDKGKVSGKAAIAYSGIRLDNSGGLISAVGPVTLTIAEVQNALGRISSQGDLLATIGLLQQQGGALVAQGNLSLTGKTLDNRNNGLVGTTKALTVNVEEIDNRAGEFSASESLTITGQHLNNADAGKVLAGKNLTLAVASVNNQNQGLISVKGAATLKGRVLDNSNGNFDSLNGLDIALDEALLNVQGLVSSEGALTIRAGRIDNSAGSLGSAGELLLHSRGDLLNQAGSISTDSTLTLKSDRLDNSQKGLISSKAVARLDSGDFDNSHSGQMISGAALDIKAKQVNNGSGRIASQQALTMSVSGLDQQGGELFSKADLTLDLNHGQLNNQKGLINAPGALLLKNLNGVNNQGGEISSQQAFTLAAHDLDNSSGKLLSQRDLTLRIEQALNNIKGIMAGASLDSHSDSLDNHEGLISSRGELLLVTDKTLANQLGTVIADGQLTLTAQTLDNASGNIAGKSDATVNAKSLNNQKGQMIATGVLGLTAETLDNRLGGLLGATQALTINSGEIDNRGGEITSHSTVAIAADKVDNSDAGQIFSGQALTLTIDQLRNRNSGLINSRSLLDLHGRVLDNSGGNLFSLQQAHLDLSGAFDNSHGKVSSERQLTVKTAQLSNTQGSLSSAEDLTLDSQAAVDNQGGSLVTDGALKLASTRLDNSHNGTISAKGAVTVNTGMFDNSQSGQLNSASTLDLQATLVNNGDRGRIGSEDALTASVTGLDQQGGQLFSKTSLSLDMNNGQLNNQNGFINAPGALLLKQLNGVNNQGGEISSKQAFTLTAQSLDNSNGKLLSSQGLTLRIANALNNVKGVIGATSIDVRSGSLNNSGGSLDSRGNFDLAVDGMLRNDASGVINADTALHISSGDLNNDGGMILAVDAIKLNAMAMNNRNNGLINSRGTLSLTGTTLDSSNGGEVSAKDDIHLALNALTQNSGRLLGEKAVTVNLAGGDLDNRNGLLTANGLLTLERLRDLNNDSGEISSSLGFDVVARTVINNAGKLISSQKLTVDGTALVNRNGLISGWEGLIVKGASLDNRAGGTLSSRNGNVRVALQGELLNSGSGALVSHGTLNVSAGSLDNSDKGIISSGEGQTLAVDGTLSNAQGGLIDSGATLNINSGALSNVGGTVNAQQAIEVSATGLDNRNGQIVSDAAINLKLSGQLNNSAGKLAGAGPLSIKGVTDLGNRNGQLISQSTLDLQTQSLDNSDKGTLAASGELTISASGAVLNHADGLIYSQTAGLVLKANSLSNAKGAIQSQNGLTLDVIADLDNQSGRIIAETGAVSVNAASIDNRGGVLASIKGLLEARTVGVLRNGVDLNNNRQGGIIQAQGLKVTALAGLSNSGGRISAQAADLSITTAAMDNSNGGIYAKNLLSVSGSRLDNSVGQIAANRIDLALLNDLNNRGGVIESDTILTVQAASLDNQTGKLRSLSNSGKTVFQIGGLLDNRNGVVETGNTDLTLAVGSFQNSGGQLLHLGEGTFDISTANVTGAGGSIVTRGGLTLNADSWSNSSVIQAGRLNVNVNNFSQTASGQILASTHLQGRGGNWNNDGLIASDGTLDVQLTGSYGGNGRVSSVGDLTLGAAQLTVNEAASVAGGGLTKLNVGGPLTNMGRLTSADAMEIRAGTVINLGTLASAKNMLINAQNLSNNRIRVNQGSLLFSGGHMNLQVGTLTNTYSDLYSLGDINVLGYNGADRAGRVDNLSGRIESTGDMSLKSAVVNNKMENFSVTTTEGDSSSIGVRCFNCDSARPKHMEDVDSHLVWQQTFNVTVSGDADASSITAGRNLSVTGSEFINSNSTVSASSDITINVDTFNNSGSSLGSYSSLKYITNSAPKPELWDQIVNYNSHNDAGYNKDIRFWTAGGVESQVTPWIRNNPHVGEIRTQYIGTYSNDVWGGGDIVFGASQYASGVRVQAPAEIINATPFQTVITESAGKTYVPAIVQAGGNVAINATNNISNGELKSFSATAAGPGKTADTRAGGGAKPTVISLNRQLPPDLAQQQVNPLASPGFALPSGQNGLFRLSGQGASSESAAPLPGGSQNWTIGGASVTQTLRQVDVPGGGRTLTFDAINPVGVTDRQLSTVDRKSADPSSGQSAIDTSVQFGGGPSGGTPSTSLKDNASQTLARVQGLPDTRAPSNAHKYLIETNPVLTELKQFMSSDYLLANLGYDPDQSAKRLGDGLYEQRLIQQAVVERTGQRFIDGQTSDEGLFKYLMNNAIASKDQLNLSVGVTLTAEQVAALTHDIVWLEEHEVNGEKVLVPVLYLAQANNRLAPNGALIQGTNVKLIAGEDLHNTGTLRASNNLTAAAGNDLVNSGLIEAGNRLDLLAGNSIVNQSGGIITGRDVNLVAVKGDIINERTVTSSGFASQGYSQHREYLDNASRIEASNDLKASAGRDFISTGSALTSGRDTVIEAGRDASIVSAQSNNSAFTGATTSSVHQVGSTATAGRDLTVNAGRDLSVIGSQISAQRDIGMSADRDLLIASAEEESHSYYKSKKVTAQEDHIDQIASSISAGGKAGFTSGKDLTVVSSRITAGDEAYLFAGNDINVLAAEDYDYSLYDKKKKGSLGRKETRRDEVTTVTHIGSEISSGGDLTIASGGDQLYQAASLKAGKDLTISSGGDLSFESVTDLKKESHEKSKSSLAWTSAKGAGQTDESIRQSHLLAAGDIVIKAAGDIRIDVKEVTQKTVADSIDAMVKADPQLAWLKDMQNRGDIDWRMIKEVHDQWDYESSGMGMGAAIAVAIIVTVLTAGAASAAVGGTLASGTGSTFAAATATTAAGVGNVALTAVITSMASTAAVSAINNKGNLADTLKDVLSEENIKSYVTAAIIAGAGSYTNTWGKVVGPQGNLITQSVTERLKAYAVNTALKGLLTGDGSDKSWLTIAGTGALAEIYAYWTGRGPDIRPGEDRPGGPEFTQLEDGLVPREWINGEWVEGKNIGLNKECASLLAVCHGTLISNIANSVPGMNAFATLHDTWMDKLIIAKGGMDMTLIENLGTMPPALVVNYGALYDQYRPLIEQTKREARQ
ncbi:hypothetical protein BJN42_09000 [Pseudomonas koreensis]|nr:hypothetical protein BJN42_09000 [Pseudomonas koreensis]